MTYKERQSITGSMRELAETMNLNDMKSMVSYFPHMLGKSDTNRDLIKICRNYYEEGIKGLCFLGMGGSSIIGAYVKEIISQESNIPVSIVRTYFLPKYVTSDWAVVAVSYSGNTEETLSSLQQARERGTKIVTVTSGGQMAKEYSDYPQILVQKQIQPRAAFPLLLSEVLPVSESIIGAQITDMDKISETVVAASKKWGEWVPIPSIMAQKVQSRIPLFVGAQHLIPVAYRAKCQINENSKALAFYSEIPESAHNEIEGFPSNHESSIIPIFLRSRNEDAQIKRKIDAILSIYSDMGLNTIVLNATGKTKIENMLTLTHYVDMVSVELADINGVDALSVRRIGELKKKLASM
jgi:glucose/mannose-6-phosphate isomerase